MRQLITVVIFAIFCSSTWGQEYPMAPDDQLIGAAILDSDSPMYYPELFERYVKGDTTLNLEEFRCLYYGYTFQNSYTPLESNNYSDSLLMVLQQVQGTVIPAELFDDILLYASKVLETRPFDLNFINLMTYCYQKQGNMEEADLYSFKLQMIIETIFSSGKGNEKDSPWHILYREDASDILGLIGATFYKRMYISTTVEYYYLTKKVDGKKGYYFDISRLYLKKPEPTTTKRKMEFNPKTNPKSDKFQSPEKRY